MAKKKEVVLDPIVVQNKARMDQIVAEIKRIYAHIDERKAILIERIKQLTEQVEDKDVCDYARIRHLEEELKVLIDIVPKRETATMYKVDLISGNVELKKAKKDYGKDLNKLLSWAMDNGIEEYIDTKVTNRFKWAEFKANLAIQEGLESSCVIDTTTGEMLNIDGLSVIEVPEEVVIK